MSGFGVREKLDVTVRTHPPLAVLGGQECLVLSERLEALGAEVALVVEGHPHRGMHLSEGHDGLSASRLRILTEILGCGSPTTRAPPRTWARGAPQRRVRGG